MYKFYVYQHCFNDKYLYIGKGSQYKNGDERYNDFGKRNNFWQKCYNKYGKPVITVFAYFQLESDAYEFERIKIQELKNNGYKLLNLSEGGLGGLSGRDFTTEHRRKIGDVRRGMKRDQNTVIKAVQTRKARGSYGGGQAWNKGKTKDEDYRVGVQGNRTNTWNKGINTPGKRVICVETNEEFISLTFVAKKLNVTNYHMKKAIKENLLLNGFHWILV